jgi:hypothetical protein
MVSRRWHDIPELLVKDKNLANSGDSSEILIDRWKVRGTLLL